MYRIILSKLLTSILVLSVSSGILAQEYAITDFGAKNDGKTLSSTAIQSAIDTAHKNGGGRVIVSEGVFLTGSIILKSGVELHLKKEAILLGSTNPYDYKGLNRWKSLVLADGQNKIAITGEGIIDGQGQKLALQLDSLFYVGKLDSIHYNLHRNRPSEVLRPQLIEIVNCSQIEVSGVTLKNAASWVQTYDKCTDLVIDNIRVDSDVYWNNDGIDISDCTNVRITNSYVNAADDGICLKSHTKGFLNQNIYIANCTIRSSASAIKFGTASVGGFKNIIIENITIFDTFRSALAFEAVDGGTIENVVVTNVSATTTGNALFIKLGHRNVDGKIGAIRNVKIKNLNVHIPFSKPDLKYTIRGPEPRFFHNVFPASISGLPGYDVEDITLENVSISYPGRGDKGYAYMPTWRLNTVPEKASSYPEFSMFGELPSWGFYVRHVSGLEMKNVRLSVREQDFRPAYVFDDVKGLKIEGGSITSLSENGQLVIKDVKSFNVSQLSVDGQALKKVTSYGANSEISGVEQFK
ncbi:glycoside hydrolase [Arenibacter sp. H213]|nr:glycoside hydrolase [Arenibacter sp. H213]